MSLILVMLLAAGVAQEPAPAATSAEVPDYQRDIRPILSHHCFECHGNDAESREADLRLDTREGATRDLGGYAAIAPGDVDDSELIYRVTTDDRDDHMPKSKSGASLSPEEIDLLRRWIEAGAPYSTHWSLLPPTLPEVPWQAAGLEATDPAVNAIDAFVRARLQEHGLTPAAEADRRTLIRRVSLDLTGLPPSPEEVDAFLADPRPDAYAHLVDRLLASDRHAERMAMAWLDAARYADTNGYHIDNERYMWPWRDWLIDAFRRNEPFDQFTIDMLAGDLLPQPTREQLIATGFNRNHMINFEGGAIAAEYRNEYVVDRVNTTAKVWLGLTMNCAQCHDHKYDPISQEEYYRMYAFFNTIDEQGLDGQAGNAQPLMAVPTPAQEAALADFRREIEATAARQESPDALIDSAQRVWEARQRREDAQAWTAAEGLAAMAVEVVHGSPLPSTSFRQLADGSLLAEGSADSQEDFMVTGHLAGEGHRLLRLQAIPDPALPTAASGRAANGNFVLSEIELSLRSLADPSQEQVVHFRAAMADHQQPDYPVTAAIDGDLGTGWAADAHKRREGRVAIFLSEEPFGFAEGAELHLSLRFRYGSAHSLGRFRLGFSRDAATIAAMLPTAFTSWQMAGPLPATGKPQAAFAAPELTFLDQPQAVDGQVFALAGEQSYFLFRRRLQSPVAREVLWSLGSDDGILLWLDGQLLLDNQVARAAAADQDRVRAWLSQGEHELRILIHNQGGPGGLYFKELAAMPGLPGPVLAALPLAPAARSESQQAALRHHYRRLADPAWAAAEARLESLRQQEAEVKATVPTTMVMREQEMPRTTYRLTRGNYDAPAEEVQPGVPAALPPLAQLDGRRANRLDLARWLVSEDNPLTARVIVNRYWAMLFGRGLVATVADFGSQGSFPSHPQLLDYLAVRFRESGWDTRALLRLMVMSATYRQDSRRQGASAEQDPENIWLARGPRFRLSAEMVRDQALAASGLLVEKLGGPSVKPYQPAGLWREVAYGGGNSNYTAGFYEQDHGDALWRRSMYTFRKRSSPPPAMQVFDAPNREVCLVQRSRTNTPLQALVTLNDPTFLEAARVLAQRVLQETAPDDRTRLDRLMLHVDARPLAEEEAAALAALLAERRQAFAAAPEEAEAFLAVGEAPRDMTLAPEELAAWSVVASVVLNLDETLTRP